MDPNTQQPNRFDPTVDPNDIPEPQLDDTQSAAQKETDRQERVAYLRSLAPPKKPRKKLVGVLVVLAIIALLGGGAAAYFLLTPKDDDKKDSPATTTQQTETPPPVTKVLSATEVFDSTLFGLSIKYAKGWEAAEGEGRLTITSPPMRLSDVNNDGMTGQVVIGIVAKGQGLSAFSTGNGGALMDSVKLTYKTPTSVQRAQTYLSFVQYPATTAAGAMDALYVTGDYGYLKTQAVPMVDLAKLDPVVSVTFLKCTDASCGTAAATAVAGTNWANPVIGTPIQTTLESLTFNEF